MEAIHNGDLVEEPARFVSTHENHPSLGSTGDRWDEAQWAESIMQECAI